MKRNFSFVISILMSHLLFSFNYTPIDTANLSIRIEKSKQYLENSKQYNENLKSKFRGQKRTFVKECLIKHQESFNEELLHGDYVFDRRFDMYIDSIVTQIRKFNPTIPDSLKFYISKSSTLNASYIGGNAIVVNMGTFYYLNNDAEFAAIISHELGHHFFNHITESILRRYNFENVESKSQLSEIKKDRYNKGTKALERYKSILYKDGKLNKQDEIEADSLGYVIFRNSQFKSADYLSVFNLMAQYDSIRPNGLQTQTYKLIFDLPNQKFKEEWFKREDFSAYDYSKYQAKFNKDSLSSHPEVSERIRKLIISFPELNNVSDPTKPSQMFLSLRSVADYEQVSNLDFNEEYGYGIYVCLLKLQQNLDTDYYHRWLGHFFQKVYDARKSYTLNKHLDKLVPNIQSESYQLFISFMWNLNLTELKVIADYYTKKAH